MKTKSLIEMGFMGRCLIIGDHSSAFYLLKRVEQLTEVTQVKCCSPSNIFGDWDCMAFVGVSINDIPRNKLFNSRLIELTHEEARGFVAEQNELYWSDWQAIKVIEKELLRMHENGAWALSEDSLAVLKKRQEIRDTANQRISELPTPFHEEP